MATTDFHTQIRGGAWTRANKGVAYDSIRGHAITEVARHWARQYGLGISFSCSYKKFAEGTANALALAWCHRMQFFFNISKESSNLSYRYTEQDYLSYAPDPDFVAFVDALPLDSPVWERVSQIRSKKPSATTSASASSSSTA